VSMPESTADSLGLLSVRVTGGRLSRPPVVG
jgi:hypothetical protein